MISFTLSMNTNNMSCDQLHPEIDGHNVCKMYRFNNIYSFIVHSIEHKYQVDTLSYLWQHVVGYVLHYHVLHQIYAMYLLVNRSALLL
jgi:hypothetical protein